MSLLLVSLTVGPRFKLVSVIDSWVLSFIWYIITSGQVMLIPLSNIHSSIQQPGEFNITHQFNITQGSYWHGNKWVRKYNFAVGRRHCKRFRRVDFHIAFVSFSWPSYLTLLGRRWMLCVIIYITCYLVNCIEYFYVFLDIPYPSTTS